MRPGPAGPGRSHFQTKLKIADHLMNERAGYKCENVSGSEISEGARRIQAAVAANLKGQVSCVYSVCCSHPLVIEAAVDQALHDGTDLLIEATANQVNQYGGYTGMCPADFRDFVYSIAHSRGLSADRLILGGDHLGPVCWTSEPAEKAMDQAEELVRSYAAAGFAKIHLDCSMSLPGDPEALDDTVVAARAARLCQVAEAAAIEAFGTSAIVYVIGTEVPPPGGADEELSELDVTPVDRVARTLAVHEEAFRDAGLDAVWRRVVAIVVQPGVEFDHGAVIDYRPERAGHLKQFAERVDNMIAFEAHSTDYQQPAAFGQLARDHFAILKVGPALTFALREALFALSHIEDELIDTAQCSNLREICDKRMLDEPKNWQRFYSGESTAQRLLRRYSLSDRIRYYWPDPAIEHAIMRLFANLDGIGPIPLGLLSQYLPLQFHAVRAGKLSVDATSLAKAGVRNALLPYVIAKNGEYK